MLQVTDISQTRVFQEALQEGVEKVARRMIDKGRPTAEIAELTGLTLAQVRKLIKKSQK